MVMRSSSRRFKKFSQFAPNAKRSLFLISVVQASILCLLFIVKLTLV
jgi:hypothetical protein